MLMDRHFTRRDALSAGRDSGVGDADESLRTLTLRPGESLRLPPLRRHRLTAVVTSDILEASTPELDDVVRLSDRYGRA